MAQQTPARAIELSTIIEYINVQMLIKPLLGVASDAIGGYVETRKAKAEQN